MLERAVRRAARGQGASKPAGPRIGGKEGRNTGRDTGRDTAVKPENIVWIFGAGRTGSSWLSAMMGELEGHTVWFEPWVGALFDPDHLRLEERRGKHFILSPSYKGAWLRSIRTIVQDGAGARFPEMAWDDYLVIKEPGGSVGASLLMEALPESRMILLVRDPRDVVASWVDAHKKGSWRSNDKGPEDSDQRTLKVSERYLRHVGAAKRAYEAHEGRKVLVKYEELRGDTAGTMKRIYSELDIPANGREIERAVAKHAWENISEKDKGEGKFYRKAKPGGWSEDLTPGQVETVEKITAPLLEAFYPDTR